MRILAQGACSAVLMRRCRAVDLPERLLPVMIRRMRGRFFSHRKAKKFWKKFLPAKRSVACPYGEGVLLHGYTHPVDALLRECEDAILCCRRSGPRHGWRWVRRC